MALSSMPIASAPRLSLTWEAISIPSISQSSAVMTPCPIKSSGLISCASSSRLRHRLQLLYVLEEPVSMKNNRSQLRVMAVYSSFSSSSMEIGIPSYKVVFCISFRGSPRRRVFHALSSMALLPKKSRMTTSRNSRPFASRMPRQERFPCSPSSSWILDLHSSRTKIRSRLFFSRMSANCWYVMFMSPGLGPRTKPVSGGSFEAAAGNAA
mmetsp:Transcript_19282/g.32040  ORF Transcript_19282/g.32040 Transcript_19282/m.32040 type:complete len:210 (+) Transcript_19282:457-1086(+)